MNMYKDNRIACPDCGGFLRRISSCIKSDKLIALYYCEKCVNGLDKEWEVTYSKEDNIEKIERYFVG